MRDDPAVFLPLTPAPGLAKLYPTRIQLPLQMAGRQRAAMG